MKDTLQQTQEAALALWQSERETDPVSPLRPEQVREQVDLSIPKTGLGHAAALEKARQVVGMTPKTSGRRFYNQLFAGREPAATSAEMLGAMLNSSMYTYKVAGVHALIENELIRRLCAAAGYAKGDGTFVPGGSLGNLVALAMAAYEARPELRDRGMSGPRLRIYVSDDAHYSIRKNAGILGLGRNSVVRVRTDRQCRMRVDDLEQRIAADRAAGHEPACIVATAGTTVAGAFDPILPIAEVARTHGLWLHVDACFGGTFLLHSQQREKLAGVELADSIAHDPHKMMGIPLPCAVVLTRQSGLLRKHFDEAADYLYQQDAEDLNLGTKSIQCGRRNDAFKLWAAWQDLGDDGWQRRIDRQLALLATARSRVESEASLDLACEPESLTLCFTVQNKPSDAICEQLSSTGLAQVGYGVVNGQKVIRLVTTNPELRMREIDRFFDDLLLVAESVPDVVRSRDSDEAEVAVPS